MDTWRSRDLRSAECASLTTRILHNSPLQSVTGVWTWVKKKKKKKKKKKINLIQFFDGKSKIGLGKIWSLVLGFRSLVARLVPFERGGNKAWGRKIFLAMESVNSLRISAPPWWLFRGSASYIVREVHSVRERERQRKTEVTSPLSR